MPGTSDTLFRILGDSTRRRILDLLADVVVSAVVLIGLFWIGPGNLFATHTGPGAFYEIVPYLAMVIPGMALFFFGIAIWARGAMRSWSETSQACRSGWCRRTRPRRRRCRW